MLIKAKYNETVTTITSKEQSPATHLLYIRLMYSKRGARKKYYKLKSYHHRDRKFLQVLTGVQKRTPLVRHSVVMIALQLLHIVYCGNRQEVCRIIDIVSMGNNAIVSKQQMAINE